MNAIPDLLDPDSFFLGIPHEAFRKLRNEAPVSWQPSADGLGYWVVSRHEDIIEVLRNPEVFSSARGGAAVRRLSEYELQTSRRMLMAMDPPEHSRFRKLVTRPFAVAVIEHLKPRIVQLSVELLEEVAGREQCDLVRDLAAELPMRVILELLGVPAADRRHLFLLSNALMHVDDTDMSGGVQDVAKNLQELVAYFIELAKQKRRQPEDDLLTRLAQCEVDGDRLSDEELGLFFVPLLIAGNETTRSLIASGMHLLLERPELYARLRADRSLLPRAIEEMLRYVSPIIQQRRTATRDIEFKGQKIREGDMVILPTISANFDETVFQDPHQFDISRHPNHHVAFGAGPHLCFGAALTRVETLMFFELFLDRFVAIEPAGPAKRVRSNTMNLLKSLPVRLVREVRS